MEKVSWVDVTEECEVDGAGFCLLRRDGILVTREYGYRMRKVQIDGQWGFIVEEQVQS